MQLEDALEPIGIRAAGPQPEVAPNHMRRGPEGVTLNSGRVAPLILAESPNAACRERDRTNRLCCSPEPTGA